MEQELFKANKIIIKVGTESVTDSSGLNLKLIAKLAGDIAFLQSKGKSIVLVTSGAIAAGKRKCRLKSCCDISLNQAYSAIGQPLLMKAYIEAFSKYNQPMGQFLLSADDLSSKTKLRNLQNTYGRFKENNILPVVNENDTTSTEEISFGDNDILASLLTCHLDADLLLILTSVDGLYKDGKILELADMYSLKDYDSLPASKEGRGGLLSKLKAASTVVKAGKCCIIANVAYNVQDILKGKVPETVFLPKRKKLF